MNDEHGENATGFISSVSVDGALLGGRPGRPDFGQGFLSTVHVQSALGPHALPVYQSSTTNDPLRPTDVHDLTGGGEITWWSPALNSNVSSIGPGSLANGFDATMFPPGPNLGSADGPGFGYLTAHFQGNFSTGTDETMLGLTLGSDDDAYLFIDGMLAAELGGVHGFALLNGPAGIQFTIDKAGPHTLDLFYADREPAEARLRFDLLDLSTDRAVDFGSAGLAGSYFFVEAVPEPATRPAVSPSPAL